MTCSRGSAGTSRLLRRDPLGGPGAGHRRAGGGLTLVGLGVLDWRLALAGLVPLPVWVLVTRWYLCTSGLRYAAARAAAARRTQALLDGVGSAATVRAYRRQGPMLRRIARDS